VATEVGNGKGAIGVDDELQREMDMSDGPSPDDFRAKVFRDRKYIDDWRVEKMDEGGRYEVAVFSGGDARQRAIRYADREYGEFDEIGLEPYAARP
jgi:hypothetical protein